MLPTVPETQVPDSTQSTKPSTVTLSPPPRTAPLSTANAPRRSMNSVCFSSPVARCPAPVKTLLPTCKFHNYPYPPSAAIIIHLRMFQWAFTWTFANHRTITTYTQKMVASRYTYVLLARDYRNRVRQRESYTGACCQIKSVVPNAFGADLSTGKSLILRFNFHRFGAAR